MLRWCCEQLFSWHLYKRKYHGSWASKKKNISGRHKNVFSQKMTYENNSGDKRKKQNMSKRIL